MTKEAGINAGLFLCCFPILAVVALAALAGGHAPTKLQ